MIEAAPGLKRVIRQALEEDLGSGDPTTDAVVDPAQLGAGALSAGEDLVVSGLDVFEGVFRELEPQMVFETLYREGDRIPSGTCICRLKGRFSSMLKGERTALNFIQRMSGIATLTRRFVEAAGRSTVRILDTRKTAPGLRLLDKRAVRAGGGANHRFNLADGILIKDNHILAAGSVSRAVELAVERAPHTLKVEVEVESLAGAKEAVRAGADAILLDNMSLEAMAEVVGWVKGRVLTEASGGVKLDTVSRIADTGVDFISVGSLTHSARASDLSLEITPLPAVPGAAGPVPE